MATMWQQAVSFVKERPLLSITAALILFFSSPAIIVVLVICSPIVIPALALALVSKEVAMHAKA